MEYFEQNLERFKTPGIAAATGIGAALVIATMPHVFLESAVGATGLSEIFSAAAPPLGNTARGLIAVVAGLVTGSALYLFLNRSGPDAASDTASNSAPNGISDTINITDNISNREGTDMSLALRKSINERESAELEAEAAQMSAGESPSEKSKFASKFLGSKFSLKKLLQKPVKKKSAGEASANDRIMDLSDLPKLREADAHPDAPARRPIFAETDLGAPLPSAAPQAMAPEIAEMPAPAVPELKEQAENAPYMKPQNMPDENMGAERVAAPAAEQVSYPDDLSELSIGQLANRLETGLARLKQLEAAMMPAMAVAQMDHAAPQRQETPQADTHATRGGISVTSTEPAPAPKQNSAPPLKPVEAPAPSEAEVQAVRQADMDAALKAALGTLEKMTAHR